MAASREGQVPATPQSPGVNGIADHSAAGGTHAPLSVLLREGSAKQFPLPTPTARDRESEAQAGSAVADVASSRGVAARLAARRRSGAHRYAAASTVTVMAGGAEAAPLSRVAVAWGAAPAKSGPPPGAAGAAASQRRRSDASATAAHNNLNSIAAITKAATTGQNQAQAAAGASARAARRGSSALAATTGTGATGTGLGLCCCGRFSSWHLGWIVVANALVVSFASLAIVAGVALAETRLSLSRLIPESAGLVLILFGAAELITATAYLVASSRSYRYEQWGQGAMCIQGCQSVVFIVLLALTVVVHLASLNNWELDGFNEGVADVLHSKQQGFTLWMNHTYTVCCVTPEVRDTACLMMTSAENVAVQDQDVCLSANAMRIGAVRWAVGVPLVVYSTVAGLMALGSVLLAVASCVLMCADKPTSLSGSRGRGSERFRSAARAVTVAYNVGGKYDASRPGGAGGGIKTFHVAAAAVQAARPGRQSNTSAESETFDTIVDDFVPVTGGGPGGRRGSDALGMAGVPAALRASAVMGRLVNQQSGHVSVSSVEIPRTNSWMRAREKVQERREKRAATSVTPWGIGVHSKGGSRGGDTRLFYDPSVRATRRSII